MAIFSRRTIQRLINENARFLSRKQVKEHVNKLNRNDLASSKGQEPLLDTEWEVAILNAFSKVGRVSYEVDFGGRRKPDLYFVSETDSNQFFAADITALSDKGFESHNPYRAFEAELIKRAGERGLRLNSFSLRVEGNNGQLYRGGPKARLQLPGIAKFAEKIFNDRFQAFLDQITNSPNERREYRVINIEENIKLGIGYDPQQKYASASYHSYKRMNHLTDNIVYSRLLEKRDQLLESNFKGPLAIILCDGGFDAFNRASDYSSYSLNEVVKRFLLEHTEVDFILTFSIECNSNLILLGRWARNFFHEGHMGLLSCIDRVIEVFPEVESDPANAINHLKGGYPNKGNSHWGGGEIGWGSKYMQIKISSRALLELLAGKVSQQEFFERYGFVPSEWRPGPYANPFDIGLNKGLTISQLSFEKTETEDDDWIIFEMAGPDPAISPFTVPPDAGTKS